MIEESKYRIRQDLSEFAPKNYTSEDFTDSEKELLKPYFSNLDQPVFAITNVKEEVAGALCARYSRSQKGLRRIFLDEYILPLLAENSQEVNAGSEDNRVDLNKARAFLGKWLGEYGDDSISELASIHVCVEGTSMLTSLEIEKNQHMSAIEKSTRYVPFDALAEDGEYRFTVPGEIVGTEFEQRFKQVMHNLFQLYSDLLGPYVDYIKQRYPKGNDESDGSFNVSRRAKGFDDLREILPFATQTSFAVHAKLRTFEDIINSLISHPLGELKWLGQSIWREINKVAPQYVSRCDNQRGVEIQEYDADLGSVRGRILYEAAINKPNENYRNDRVQLFKFTPNAADEILTTFLFDQNSDLSLEQVSLIVKGMTYEQKADCFNRIFDARKLGDPNTKRESIRFKRVPEAFNNAQYLFGLLLRGGDLRDLHRHRPPQKGMRLMTTKLGYDLEQEVMESPFKDRITQVFTDVEALYSGLAELSPYLAQYVVPFSYLQQLYMDLSAADAYWMIELRTGSQGRPEYRKICQMIADKLKEIDPLVFSGLMTDYEEYRIARRLSAKRAEEKRQNAN